MLFAKTVSIRHTSESKSPTKRSHTAILTMKTKDLQAYPTWHENCFRKCVLVTSCHGKTCSVVGQGKLKGHRFPDLANEQLPLAGPKSQERPDKLFAVGGNRQP